DQGVPRRHEGRRRSTRRRRAMKPFDGRGERGMTPETATTLPRFVLRNARDLSGRPAIREKDRGIWQTWTWAQYCAEVRDFALGLAASGMTGRESPTGRGADPPPLSWPAGHGQALG